MQHHDMLWQAVVHPNPMGFLEGALIKEAVIYFSLEWMRLSQDRMIDRLNIEIYAFCDCRPEIILIIGRLMQIGCSYEEISFTR